MQRQGRRGFLKSFYRSPSPSLSSNLAKPWHKQQPIPCHYYGRNRGAMPANGRPPYPAEVR
jgi:hypothetical protein